MGDAPHVYRILLRKEADVFSYLLGTPFISTEVLTAQTERTEYFSACRTAGNLFLDPDTGVCLKRRGGKNSINYVFANELVECSQTRPKYLTLVFDQSYSRGQQNTVMREKLRHFAEQGINGFVYSSHATFVLIGTDRKVVAQARKRLIGKGLPAGRLVGLDH